MLRTSVILSLFIASACGAPETNEVVSAPSANLSGVALSASPDHAEAIVLNDQEPFEAEQIGCRGSYFWAPEGDLGLTAVFGQQIVVRDGLMICEAGEGFSSPSEVPYTCGDEAWLPKTIDLNLDDERADRTGLGFIVVDQEGNMTQALITAHETDGERVTLRLALE